MYLYSMYSPRGSIGSPLFPRRLAAFDRVRVHLYFQSGFVRSRLRARLPPYYEVSKSGGRSVCAGQYFPNRASQMSPNITFSLISDSHGGGKGTGIKLRPTQPKTQDSPQTRVCIKDTGVFLCSPGHALGTKDRIRARAPCSLFLISRRHSLLSTSATPRGKILLLFSRPFPP
jgi:hypothetical protein